MKKVLYFNKYFYYILFDGKPLTNRGFFIINALFNILFKVYDLAKKLKANEKNGVKNALREIVFFYKNGIKKIYCVFITFETL